MVTQSFLYILFLFIWGLFMNQLLNHKKAKLFCLVVNICFLSIHILMICVFALNHVTPMIYFNIFSIVFYIATIFFIKLGYLRFFVISTYLEVLLHMTLAVFYTGWGNGFQITLIGMNVLAFFAEYMGRSIRGKYVPASPLCVLGMLAYTFSYFITNKYGVLYQVSDKTSNFLQIMWGIVVFVIGITCLQGFTLLSFYSARLLSIAATKDKLTGLPNRYYIAKFEEEFLSDNRWIAMADIDNFKRINDTYGHNFGDYVLQTLADLMQKEIEESDICRWGGEEFLIIGHGRDIKKAYKILDNFRVAVEKYNFSNKGSETNLTITIGLAKYEAGLNMTDWVNIADKKLYAGKYSGNNKIVI